MTTTPPAVLPPSLLDQAVTYLRGRMPAPPRVGVVLGSGLGGWADGLEGLVKIPYGDIPGMPVSTVVGHAGNLCVGRDGHVPVACLQGRVHLYEGHAIERVVFGARLLARLGCGAVLLTNAAGGINPAFAAGDLMLVTDHLNLMGANPLAGPNDPSLGKRFPDMTHAHDPRLLDLARAASAETNVTLREGIYAGLLGPSYETPAEVRMVRLLGGDAVGMSTVPEIIALRHMGVPAAAVSCITNLAAGLSDRELDHAEVEETARLARARFTALLSAWVRRVGAEVAPRSPAGDAPAGAAGGAAPAIDWEALGRAALAVRERAHAPYSGYAVGAALLVRSGRVFTGCNVENASFGLSICAERSAVLQMVASGASDPVALVVATRGPETVSPCGVCRQTLAEFADELPIRLVVADGASPPRHTTLSALLPDAFRAPALNR